MRKKHLLMWGLVALVVVIVMNDKHQQTQAMTADDLASKGYNICAGKNWQCCEPNTYYFQDSTITSKFSGMFTDMSFPKRCCSGLHSTTTIISADPSVGQRITSFLIVGGGVTVITASAVFFGAALAPILTSWTASSVFVPLATLLHVSTTSLAAGTAGTVTGLAGGTITGWDFWWSQIKTMFGVNKQHGAYICEDIPDIPGVDEISRELGITGKSAMYVMFAALAFIVLLVLR